MKNKKSLKIIATLLSFALLFSSIGIPVFATDTGTPQQESAAVEDSASKNLEQGEEQAEEMQVVQEMPQEEPPLPEVKPDITDVQEERAVYSLASINSFQILESEKQTSDVTTGLLGTVNFNLPTTLGGSAKTLWIGYRFTLPHYSPSGGEYSFVKGTYSWLQPLDGQGQIDVREENGNWILEGKVLAQNIGGNVAPGLFSPSVSVHMKNLVNGETAVLKGESWLIDSTDQPIAAQATMTSKGECKYSTYNWMSGTPKISGYFNKTTGEFSVLKPKNPEGYVYGRVYAARQLMWNDRSSERIDPTKPISYDLEWKLVKVENGVKTEVTDPAKKPILMAMKRSNPEVKKSELEGLPVDDFTLGGLIEDGSIGTGPGSQPIYRDGDYTFTREAENKVHVSAVLTKDNKNSGATDAGSYALFFIPMTELSSGDSGKDPKYTFVTEAANMQGTSYSGHPIKDVSQDKDRIQSTSIYLKGSGEGLPTTGLFSRGTYLLHSASTTRKNSSFDGYVEISNKKQSTIVDYGIHSVNMLIKFEDGLSLEGIKYKNEKHYSGKVNFLYAIKKDGKPWSNEVEMNHTQDYELVYYDTLQKAKQHGTVVAVLAEFRDGVWVAGKALELIPNFKAIGDNSTSQVFVQDVKVWRGTNDKIESWVGTSGQPVTQKVKPTDLMVPYDNPANTEGNIEDRVYRRDIWPENEAKPIAVDGHTFGDTVYIIGGYVDNIAWENPEYPGKNLNGTNKGSAHGAWSQWWSTSTFDTSVGQRVVDRVYSFKVEDVGQQELSFKIALDRPLYNTDHPGHYCSRIGKVYLSTEDNPVTYIPNENEAKRGTFKGGIEIDPNNFTVPGDGKYQIYYSTFLGSETDLSKDIPARVLWDVTSLVPMGKTNRYARMGDTAIAYSTVIVKTAATSISKSSASEGTRAKAEYNLMVQEYRGRSENTFIMDILPYNGDDAGSKFHGSYRLDQNKINTTYQSAKGEAKSSMRLFYTTDKNIRNLKDGKRVEADIFRGLEVANLQNEFTAGNVKWQEAKANADHTSFELPDGVTPTAFVLAGNVEQDERVIAKVSLILEGQKVGDKYNNLSSTQLGVLDVAIPSEAASVTVIGRNVAGTAWQDKNKNGIFDEGDVTLEGVKVHLYKKDGTEIKEDANNNKYGEIITGKDGSYRFEDVPENADGYYVEFEGTDKVSINDYQTVEQYKDGAKTPFEKNNDSDVIFQNDLAKKVKTEIFKLQSDKDLMIDGTVQNADGINAGLEKALSMKAEKVWKGKADSENHVTMQLQRRSGADAPWETVKDANLNTLNSWKTTFDKQPVLHNDNGVTRYEYRVVELDSQNKPAEDGTVITLNGNDYSVKANKIADDSWRISNNRITDLTIENEVIGELGDRTKKFSVDIFASDSDGNPVSGTFACEGLDGLKTIEFQNGKANVKLAHGEKIVIKKIAHSTHFDVKVDAESTKDYTVKYKLDQGAEKDEASFDINRDSVVKILNTKTDIPDTGISNDSNDKGIFIVLGVFGIAMLGFAALRKRKGLR